MDDALSEKVIGAAFRVHNQLGFGFLESVYHKSLLIELTKARVAHETKAPIKVFHDEHVVGAFECDLLVENRLIVEIKSLKDLAKAHEVQLVNYLTATKIDIGLLINFGPAKVEVKRKYRVYQDRNQTG
jgi:GxxExxY protein